MIFQESGGDIRQSRSGVSPPLQCLSREPGQVVHRHFPSLHPHDDSESRCRWKLGEAQLV